MVLKVTKTAQEVEIMAIKSAKPLSKSDIESLAIQNVVAKLKKAPFKSFPKFLIDLACAVNEKTRKKRHEVFIQQQIGLLSFLSDVESGAYRKWKMFQTELGLIKGKKFKGRAIPIRPSRGGGKGEADRMARFIDHEKSSIGYFRPLPLWKCKNTKQKIKMITESDAPPQIKAEFLAGLVNAK